MLNFNKCEICEKITEEGNKLSIQNKYLLKLSINLCEEHLSMFTDIIIKNILNRKNLVINIEVKK